MKSTIVLVFVLLLSASICFGQSENVKDIFADFDEPQRTQLVGAIESLIKMQQKQEWEKLSNTFPVEFLQGETKEEYVKRQQSSKPTTITFVNFTPERIAWDYQSAGAEIYKIDGCGIWKNKGKNLKQYSYIKAYWRNKKWSLTEVLYDIPMHSGFIPCSKN